MSQAPTNISTYFYDASCIALSFSDPSSAYFNSSQTYYYLASAVDLSGNKTTYATGTKSPIYIQGLSAGYTYTCSLYMIQTASSDSISFTTLSYPTISDISLTDVSFNFINVKWTATDVSYVKVSRRVGTLLSYTDICGSDYSSPYSDSDISGNTTYYYYVTPYMTKYGSSTQGSVSSVVSRTTPVAYPTDVSATFYDMSAIRLTFSTPKNSYTTIAPSYTAKAVYGGNIITSSGTSPILIQNLSSDTTYACYILTYLDGSLGSTSNAISVKTNDVGLTYDTYLDTTKMRFAFSMRLTVKTYTGPVVNIRRSSDNATADFYTNTTQTYLTTGSGGSGTSYASWIGANTGYVTKWYDQSGQNNHAVNSTTGTTQPVLSLQNGKYVIRFINSNGTRLSLTSSSQPNTCFCHFYNVNSTNIGTLISTNIDYSIRITYSGTSLTADNNDWYRASGGTKISYVNNTSSETVSVNTWYVISLSTTSPTWNSSSSFTTIGYIGSFSDRGFDGYMVEMICHNTSMVASNAQAFYNNRLF